MAMLIDLLNDAEDISLVIVFMSASTSFVSHTLLIESDAAPSKDASQFSPCPSTSSPASPRQCLCLYEFSGLLLIIIACVLRRLERVECAILQID